MFSSLINGLVSTVETFLDTLEDALTRQHFDEPVEITLRTTELPDFSELPAFSEFPEGIELVEIDLPPASDSDIDRWLNEPTVELSQSEMDEVLDQIFGEWREEEKRQTANPDRLPYDPKEGF